VKRDSQSNIQNLKPKIEWLDYGLLLALILPIFTVMPLLTHTGLPNTADGPVHLMRQVELNQAWQEGNFYPRWGADLALGHGMPIFSYAPPLLYQLTQLFHLFGLPLDEAMKAVLIVDFLLYSLGMFLFARRIFGVVPALLAATVYVYVPYRLREAYIQGNYGQFTGLAFYPLLFWAFHGLITDGRPRYLIVGALSLAGLLLSHNISSMLLAPIFAAYLVFLLILTIFEKSQQSSRPSSIKHIAANDETAPDNLRVVRRHPTPGSEDAATPHRDRGEEASDAKSDFHLSSYFASRLARTVAAILLGLGLAAIFWLPAFGERHQIKLEGITRGFFDFRENFISLSEFLAPPLPLDLTAINPEFPLSLGLPQLLAAGLGIFSLLLLIIIRSTFLGAARNPHRASLILFSTSSRGNSRSPMLHSLFFTFFLLLYSFLAVPQSQAIWEAVPLLELAEFPWRMLGPAIFCASILAAFLFLVVSNHRSIVMSRLGHANPRRRLCLRGSLGGNWHNQHRRVFATQRSGASRF
jgi:hypothetical protein